MKSNLFLNEYFKKRKSLIYRSVLFFVFFVLVFATIYLNENSEEFLGKITIEGIIHDRKDILEKLSELEEKKNLKGLIFTVNSPGGTFVSSKELGKVGETGNLTVAEVSDFSIEEGILEFAKTNESDLIVMPTHGKHGIEHSLEGSIAEDVVNHAVLPVLTVKM